MTAHGRRCVHAGRFDVSSIARSPPACVGGARSKATTRTTVTGWGCGKGCAGWCHDERVDVRRRTRHSHPGVDPARARELRDFLLGTKSSRRHSWQCLARREWNHVTPIGANRSGGNGQKVPTWRPIPLRRSPADVDRRSPGQRKGLNGGRVVARKRRPSHHPPAVRRNSLQKRIGCSSAFRIPVPSGRTRYTNPDVRERRFRRRDQIWAAGPPHSGSAGAAIAGQTAPARAAASLRRPQPPSRPAGCRRRCHSRVPESPEPVTRNVRISSPPPTLLLAARQMGLGNSLTIR